MSCFNNCFRSALLTIGLLVSAGWFAAQAQPNNGGPGTNPTAVPIDGGASLLVAAGVGYGLKRLRSARRRKG